MSDDLEPATIEELDQAILDDATEGIQRVVVDGMSVENHSLKDRMAVSDRVKNKNAAALPHFGMRFTKLVPPGGGGQ